MYKYKLNNYTCEDYIAICNSNCFYNFFHHITKNKEYEIIKVIKSSWADDADIWIMILNDNDEHITLPLKYFNIVKHYKFDYDNKYVILDKQSKKNRIANGILLYHNITYSKYYKVVPGSYNKNKKEIKIYNDIGEEGLYSTEIFRFVDTTNEEWIKSYNLSIDEKIEDNKNKRKIIEEIGKMTVSDFMDRCNSDQEFVNKINKYYLDMDSLMIDYNDIEDFIINLQKYINLNNKEENKMEIKKVENYKKFAEILKEKTECDVSIEIVEKNHYHFQLDKNGLSMGVLCINEGDPSFAPFSTLKNAKNENFINCSYMPLMEDLSTILEVLCEMFTCDLVTNK